MEQVDLLELAVVEESILNSAGTDAAGSICGLGCGGGAGRGCGVWCS